jgi:antitoxin ParD1/3/4
LLEDQDAARERWLNEEIPARYDELAATPSLGVPAADVRARFDAKRRANARKPDKA